ncbi:MAG: TatD family hydrolase [Planctomycetaceae bacterium]|nr:TatD family hydrolase [Planctomycetaceae bacterium]
MDWVDTHCHLNEDAFTSDREEAISRAVAAGVHQMLVVGITLESSRRAVELAQQHAAVFAVVGIQPNYAQAAGPTDFEEIAALAQQAKVVGIGETGLDRYWDHSPFEQQLEMFHRHIALAKQLNLPFVVHCRDAEADVVSVLSHHFAAGPLNGVMHSFCGDQATADECLKFGMHLSVAGMLTFKRNDDLRKVAATVPADRLLVETDAPYLAPAPHRGKRNEPAYVRHTCDFLAEVRGCDKNDLARITAANARRVFRLPVPDSVLA